MKLSFYGKRMVRLELTEKQLETILAAMDYLDSAGNTGDAYSDVPPLYRYLNLIYRRAKRAKEIVLS